jgi:pimeloyl-ACP methyl ester carboxylesterase
MKIFRILMWIALAVLVLVIGGLAVARLAAFVRESSTAEALAPDAGHFVQADGLDIFVQEKGPENGPVVLLISGAMAWSETWRDTIDPLAAAGFRAVAIDLPPFGFSQRPEPAGYGPANHARRISALLDAMNIKRAVLVGHSYGGGATVETAFRHEARVRGLVLADVALSLDQKPSGGGATGWLLSWRPLRSAIASATFTNPLLTRKGLTDFIADDSKATEAKLAVYKRPLGVKGASPAVGDWLAGDLFAYPQGAAFKDDARYASFKPPVLIVWGKVDTVTPLTQGEDLARRFNGSRLVVMEGVNHIPHLEAPQAFNAALLDFLKSLPPE